MFPLLRLTFVSRGSDSSFCKYDFHAKDRMTEGRLRETLGTASVMILVHKMTMMEPGFRNRFKRMISFTTRTRMCPVLGSVK